MLRTAPRGSTDLVSEQEWDWVKEVGLGLTSGTIAGIQRREDTMAVVWGVKPPPRKLASSIGLVCIRAGEVVSGVKLGPLVGIQTHWAGRTVLCTGAESCQYHDEPQTWKGFCPVVLDGRSWRGSSPGLHSGVLVVSEEIGEGVDSCPVNFVFQVSRPGRRSNGAMCFEVQGASKVSKLPESWDVKPYVLRGMGLSETTIARLRTVG